MEIINETFKDYKNKFKALAIVMMPLFVIQLTLSVLITVGVFLGEGEEVTDTALYTALGLGVIGIVLGVIMALFYFPAIIRVFQRQAEGQDMTITEAVKIQRRGSELWKFIKFCFCTLVFGIMYMILTIAPGFVIVGAVILSGLKANVAIMGIAILVSIALTIYLFFMNMTKLAYALNIFFSSKGYGALQSVKEAIRIGTKYRIQTWGMLLGTMVFAIIGTIAQAAITFILMFIIEGPQALSHMKDAMGTEMAPTLTSSLVSGVFTVGIQIFFITILVYMYMAKKYQEVRKMDEGGVQDQSVIPLEHAVEPSVTQ